MTATRTSSAALIGALAAVALSGCAVAERPTLEEVQAETEAVLQQIADLLGLTPCGVGQPPAR